MTDRFRRGTLPEGRLVRSRVVADPGEALSAALDRSLTGYAVLEPQDALLLDADAAGVIAFDRGVPVAAHHAGTGRGGPAALADLAVPGPYSAELRETDGPPVPPGDDPPTALGGDARIPPGLAAEHLAGDPDLADRTRRVADSQCPTDGAGAGSGDDAGVTAGSPDDPDVAGGPAGERVGSERTGSEEAGRDAGDRPGRPGDPDPTPSADRPDPDGAVPREPPSREWADVPREAPPEPGGGDAVAAFLENERKIEAIRERASEQARRRADEWGLTEHLVGEDPERED